VITNIEKDIQKGKRSYDPDEFIPDSIRQDLAVRAGEAKIHISSLLDSELITAEQAKEYIDNIQRWEARLGKEDAKFGRISAAAYLAKAASSPLNSRD